MTCTRRVLDRSCETLFEYLYTRTFVRAVLVLADADAAEGEADADAPVAAATRCLLRGRRLHAT